MADKTAGAVLSPLNPAAPVFTMPSSKDNQVVPNGEQSKPLKPERPSQDGAGTTTAENVAETGAGSKKVGAELKKQKAAEKAARRAEKVAQKGADLQAEQQKQKQDKQQSQPSLAKSDRRPSQSGKKEVDLHHKRTGSTTTSKPLPLRSQQVLSSQHAAPPAPSSERDLKHVPFFTHLPQRSPAKPLSLSSASREIHPAVLSLSLQLRDYVICGSNARVVSMLLAFKKVIQSYITPPGVALSRHLTTHLSHQISYINLARPLSVSQGNSIRWLKKLISALDPDLAEFEAKSFLCTAIDQFIREKITLADEVIAREAGQRIVDGDVILTFGKSSVVERTLLSAHRSGRSLRVIVVDSRPLFEGKNLVRSLIRAGIEVQYSLLNALADVVEDATICFFGAAAMLGNGKLSARAGTAMVAMMAKESAARIPVIVLCETVKFTGKVTLDSVVMNELGEADALIEQEDLEVFTTTAPPAAAANEKQIKGGKKGKDEEDQEETKVKQGLEGWRDQTNLYLLNLMYDVTPAEYLDIVISELGSLPPSAVPVVNGVHGGDE